MWEEILKAIPVYFFSTLKFIFGPTLGYAAKLHIVTTILATVLGMMTSVVAFTYFGGWIRKQILNRFFKKGKKFNRSNRKFVGVWKKYGVAGVAARTPLFHTPIGGTILAVGVGAPKEKIIVSMFISGALWAIVFSFGIYLFGNAVVQWLPEVFRP
jgi:hypothetical protein